MNWPRIVVAYATRRRSEMLGRVVQDLQRQTLAPARIIVSAVEPDDVASVEGRPDVTVIYGPAGSSSQRNSVIGHRDAGADILVYFDDDFLPHPRWLEGAAVIFRDHPDIACLTGDLIADGAKGPGIAFAEAVALVESGPEELSPWIRETLQPYGCNMAFRRSVLDQTRFDERLVGYGWLEDADIGGAIRNRGYRSVQVGRCTGVHMGIKRGRVPGRQLGYSQVVNPIYLYRKGTMPLSATVKLIIRNCGSNAIRFAVPEPYVDRRGRTMGNVVGLLSVLTGRARPDQAIESGRKASVD